MGLFGFLRDAGSAIAGAVKSAGRAVVNAVKDFLGLGSAPAYDGSVSKAVEVEEVLNRFKGDLSDTRTDQAERRSASSQVETGLAGEAREIEAQTISFVMEQFDSFIHTAQSDYPDLVETLRDRQSEIRRRLSGTLMGYISKRLSENDPSFRRVLEMRPGTKKTRELAQYSQNLLEAAEREFKDKFRREMQSLNQELDRRLKNAIQERQDDLRRQEREYDRLQRELEQGELDLTRLEQECVPAADAYLCMQYLFSQLPASPEEPQ